MPASDQAVANVLKREYTRVNPKWESARRLGFSTAGIPPYLSVYQDEGSLLRFPREAAQHLPGGTRVEDRTTEGEPAYLGTPVKLRDYQRDAVAAAVAELRAYKGCVLQAAPGAGKTVMSLEVARQMGRKTLVLVHTSFLMTQWRDRITQFLGVTSGTVHQDDFDVDHGIVIAMAQTLNARRFDDDFYRQFGLVLVDETHRFAAETFQEAIVQFPARYRLGLTATPERRDKLEWVFFAHIGPVAVKAEIPRQSPQIYLVPAAMGPVDERPLRNYQGMPDHVKTISFLTESRSRNHQIAEFAVDAARNGRRVIVFSDRRAHLEDLAEIFQLRCQQEGINATFGFFVGGMKEAARAIASDRQVIFSTYQFAKEGLDIAELDTLIMATPKGDCIQAIGRIQRVLPGKPQPIVIDIVDDVEACRGLTRRRLRQYHAQGWDVEDWRD